MKIIVLHIYIYQKFCVHSRMLHVYQRKLLVYSLKFCVFANVLSLFAKVMGGKSRKSSLGFCTFLLIFQAQLTHIIFFMCCIKLSIAYNWRLLYEIHYCCRLTSSFIYHFYFVQNYTWNIFLQIQALKAQSEKETL